jgi:hypothetical protein
LIIYNLNLKSEEIKVVNKNFKFTSTVVIPTDKTSSCKCIHIDNYKDWAIKHLLKNGKKIPRSKRSKSLKKQTSYWKVLNTYCQKMSQSTNC